MQLIRKIRFSMGTIMMFVLMAAAAMALFVKILHLIDSTPIPPGWNFDVPSLFLLAIALTAVALASWKEHSAVQTMLQVTLACVGCLSLIWIGEAKYDRRSDTGARGLSPRPSPCPCWPGGSSNPACRGGLDAIGGRRPARRSSSRS